MADLRVPPTEIEVADALSLVVSMYGSASSVAQTIRRLAYQRDMLVQETERERHRKAVEAAVDKAGREMADPLFQLPTTLRGVKEA